MKRSNKKFWCKPVSFAMSALLAFSGISFSPEMTVVANAEEDLTALTDEEISALTADASFTRTSVHDPSVVYDGEGSYYVFGSHLGVSKTSDFKNWTSLYTDNPTSGIFVESYTTEFTSNTNAGTEVNVLDPDGNITTATFANYDIAEWISDNTVSGNMWAPDVIYNTAMGKWCMYLSLNGATWNSSIVLLTSDSIEGPYDYVGPVIFAGFSTADSSKSFHDTDLELVIGKQDELPEKYQKIANKTWGDYWPHTIDPAVFYDEDGNLLMVYGSWSGGIYLLELDEETGLRDYTVKYDSDYDTLGKSVTSDEYFGTKLAGGYYVSGEGPYIQHIGDYYYLFISYGFYSPEGGYNMRVFRSENPEGPYVDENGTSAIFDKYILNYSATDTTNNRGEKLMGGYQWDTMNKAELSQGHNSVIETEDGKIFLVYHTKFNDGTAGHEVRVHQLFVNEDGWLVTAPYEYAGETISSAGYDISDIAGNYRLITHDFQMNYGDLEYNSPEDIVLNSDGTITGAKEGTFTITEGTPYCQITLDGTTFKGVFTEQILGGTNVPLMCFTAVSQDGLTIWGSGEITDVAAIAITANNSAYAAPSSTYGTISLPTEGDHGTTISWTSSDTSVIADDGTVTAQTEDTTVTLTARISKGSYYYDKAYSVTVKPLVQNDTDSLVVGEYFTDEVVDLSTALSNTISVANPLYKGTASGLDLSGGVTVSFDTTSTGTVNVLATLFAFQGNGGDDGRMYFTPGSYLGYNAGGYWYDANLNSYALVEDYIGESAHVDVKLTATGFELDVDGEVCYTEEILDTDNGDGTIDGKYTKVLNWLYNTADTLYFGSGSWWSDVANNTISNVVITVGPIDSSVDLSGDEEESAENEADEITYTKDLVEITSIDYYEAEENPFYGKNLEKVTLKYTINMTEGTAQNGWDGIFSFYNTSTGGRVSMQTNPYLCYNSDGWMDINQPGDSADNRAASMTPGTEYEVVVTIDSTGVTMTVDGEELATSFNGSTTNYSKILTAISGADVLTFGVGLAQSSYWYTELCTLTDIEFTSSKSDASDDNTETGDDSESDDTTDDTEDEDVTYDEVFYSNDAVSLSTNDALTVVENPFYGKTIDELYIGYTITMNDSSVKNGWDSIISFYDTSSAGRVSVQTAPYLCYNDMSGNWIDFNGPALDGAADMAPSFESGTEHDVTITVTKDGCVMTVDGETLSIPQNGSDSATCKTLLNFVTQCDELTLGVGLAETSFWYTEICDISNLVISTGATSADESGSETGDDSGEGSETEDDTVTATLTEKWGAVYYVTEDGTKLTGFYVIDGYTYYFNESTGAAAKSAFVTVDDAKYYFDSDCHMVTGFMTKWGSTYYFFEDGTMAIDQMFTADDGYTYYASESGAIKKSSSVTIDGNTYYFDGSGHMVTGFMTKWGSTYYFDENGVQVFDSLVDADGYIYYFNAKGQMVKNTFVTLDDGTHFFDSEGHMVKDSTITRWGKSYTFDENGVLVE